jgi:hypothetical protein
MAVQRDVVAETKRMEGNKTLTGNWDAQVSAETQQITLKPAI